jgi:beta-lactamase class A
VDRPAPMSDPVTNAAQRSIETALNDFAAPGRSAIVESLRGIGVRAAVQADVVRPGASILKIPVVGAVRSSAAGGRLDLGQRVSLPIRSALPSILRVFDPDHSFTLAELCRLCLATSDNVVANYLIDLVGFAAVNDEAARWGCTATTLAVGFDDDSLDASGRTNVTTARDALVLVRALIESDPESENALANSTRNTRIPLRLPSDVRAPHKTGTLEGVVNDVGVVHGERTDLALSFLCEDEQDAALTSIEIGECVARVRQALGERTIEGAT